MPAARIVFWAATLGGIGFAIYSALTRPPSLAAAIACVVAYGAIITIGVLFLRLRMFADAVVCGPAGARAPAPCNKSRDVRRAGRYRRALLKNSGGRRIGGRTTLARGAPPIRRNV